ncbi:transglutaminase-like putative cysteine protease [Aeromicrobium panaciterrae]|uniref:Transglutaminase-like putative cysteine protease n=1 Tax=Aeromicrobium panaciterrae TaxID=363861 RepID=A0ABU1ULI1_9ACTN|nr:transglutaminase family protein [Aeromicrobium panaciterrae]MDR7086026.1 transglutaminase-like putative cysteine protease [Aeromicrobium panaciterrae]
MKRSVSAHLELELHDSADLIFSIAVAQGANLESETFSINSGGGELEVRELIGRHGTRLHRLTGPAGKMTIDYSAVAIGQADSAPVDELDLIEYRRPSRYCESDTLFSTARAEFAGVSGKALLDAVTSWVGSHLSYVPGVSLHTDGAVATMLAREGVCRDYAHLVVALLRGLDVPARLASVYAPGLTPMDFHAVAEAYVEDAWHVVDATGLAPRQSLLRIATGQDASETAFLSQHWARVDLLSMQVIAVVDELPRDDVSRLVELR